MECTSCVPCCRRAPKAMLSRSVGASLRVPIRYRILNNVGIEGCDTNASRRVMLKTAGHTVSQGNSLGRLLSAVALTLLACLLLAFIACGGGSSGGTGSGSSGVSVVHQFDGESGTGNPPLYKDHPDMAIGANGTSSRDHRSERDCVRVRRNRTQFNSHAEFYQAGDGNGGRCQRSAPCL